MFIYIHALVLYTLSVWTFKIADYSISVSITIYTVSAAQFVTKIYDSSNVFDSNSANIVHIDCAALITHECIRETFGVVEGSPYKRIGKTLAKNQSNFITAFLAIPFNVIDHQYGRPSHSRPPSRGIQIHLEQNGYPARLVITSFTRPRTVFWTGVLWSPGNDRTGRRPAADCGNTCWATDREQFERSTTRRHTCVPAGVMRGNRRNKIVTPLFYFVV